MATKKFKTDDAKFTGYGTLEVANGRFRSRLDKANWPEITQKLRVTIEADLIESVMNGDDVGQDFRIEVRKVKFK